MHTSTPLLNQHHDAEVPEETEKPLVEYFNGSFAAAILAVPDHMLQMSEVELHNAARPTPADYRLRQNITDRIREAKALGKEQITQTSIYEGVVSRSAFQQYLLPNPIKVAWMIRPVVNHDAYYEAIMREGLKKLFDIMQSTDADPKYLPQILKLTEKAADRVLGPVVQRIQMHQKQEVTHSAKITSREVDPEDPIALQAKVDEIQAKLDSANIKKLPAAVEDIDVIIED